MPPTFPVRVDADYVERRDEAPDELARGVVVVRTPNPPRAAADVVIALAIGEDGATQVPAKVVWARPARSGVSPAFGAQLEADESLLGRLREVVDEVRRSDERLQALLTGPLTPSPPSPPPPDRSEPSGWPHLSEAAPAPVLSKAASAPTTPAQSPPGSEEPVVRSRPLASEARTATLELPPPDAFGDSPPDIDALDTSFEPELPVALTPPPTGAPTDPLGLIAAKPIDPPTTAPAPVESGAQLSEPPPPTPLDAAPVPHVVDEDPVADSTAPGEGGEELSWDGSESALDMLANEWTSDPVEARAEPWSTRSAPALEEALEAWSVSHPMGESSSPAVVPHPPIGEDDVPPPGEHAGRDASHAIESNGETATPSAPPTDEPEMAEAPQEESVAVPVPIVEDASAVAPEATSIATATAALFDDPDSPDEPPSPQTHAPDDSSGGPEPLAASNAAVTSPETAPGHLQTTPEPIVAEASASDPHAPSHAPDASSVPLVVLPGPTPVDAETLLAMDAEITIDDEGAPHFASATAHPPPGPRSSPPLPDPRTPTPPIARAPPTDPNRLAAELSAELAAARPRIEAGAPLPFEPTPPVPPVEATEPLPLEDFEPPTADEITTPHPFEEITEPIPLDDHPLDDHEERTDPHPLAVPSRPTVYALADDGDGLDDPLALQLIEPPPEDTDPHALDEPPGTIEPGPFDATPDIPPADDLEFPREDPVPLHERAERHFVLGRTPRGRPLVTLRFATPRLYRAYFECYLVHGLIYLRTSEGPFVGTRVEVELHVPEQPTVIRARATTVVRPPAIRTDGLVARLSDPDGRLTDRLAAIARQVET